MVKVLAQWPDERLNDLAAALEPVPAQVAVLDASVKHLDHVAAALEPLPAQLAVLAATVDRLAEENRALRVESRNAAPTRPDRLGSCGGIARRRCRAHRRAGLTPAVEPAWKAALASIDAICAM